MEVVMLFSSSSSSLGPTGGGVYLLSVLFLVSVFFRWGVFFVFDKSLQYCSGLLQHRMYVYTQCLVSVFERYDFKIKPARKKNK